MITNIDILIDQPLSIDTADYIAKQAIAVMVQELGLDPAHVHVDVSQQEKGEA